MLNLRCFFKWFCGQIDTDEEINETLNYCTKINHTSLLCICPRPNTPRSPPFLALPQSLSVEASFANVVSPDSILSLCPVHRNKINDHLGYIFTSVFEKKFELTFNELHCLIKCACDLLLFPGRRATRLFMLHKKMRCTNLQNLKDQRLTTPLPPHFYIDSNLIGMKFRHRMQ